MSPELFEGNPDRECGEHRTTGQRAWCFDCREWCYPDLPCKGCELPALRAEVARLRERPISAWLARQARHLRSRTGGPDGC